jgi:hypothetical protein
LIVLWRILMITGLEQFKYYGEYVKGWAERDKSAGRSKVESDFRGQNKFRYQPSRLDLFYKV